VRRRRLAASAYEHGGFDLQKFSAHRASGTMQLTSLARRRKVSRSGRDDQIEMALAGAFSTLRQGHGHLSGYGCSAVGEHSQALTFHRTSSPLFRCAQDCHAPRISHGIHQER